MLISIFFHFYLCFSLSFHNWITQTKENNVVLHYSLSDTTFLHYLPVNIFNRGKTTFKGFGYHYKFDSDNDMYILKESERIKIKEIKKETGRIINRLLLFNDSIFQSNNSNIIQYLNNNKVNNQLYNIIIKKRYQNLTPIRIVKKIRYIKYCIDDFFNMFIVNSYLLYTHSIVISSLVKSEDILYDVKRIVVIF